MLRLDYDDNKFVIYIPINELDDHEDLKDFLEFLYITYDYVLKRYTLSSKKAIHEFLMWCDRLDFDLAITPEAKEQIDIVLVFEKETKYFRKLQLQESFINATMFNFQKEDIDWAIKRNRVYFAHQAGLGKTIECIGTFLHWYNYGMVDSLLVVVRRGLMYTWKREIIRFSSFTADDIQLIKNTNKDKPFEQYKDKKILIIAAHIWGDVVVSYRKGKKVKKKSSLKFLRPFVDIRNKWHKEKPCLIIDEAHDFKNSRSVRGKAVRAHKEFFDFRIYASATPAINRFEHYYFQMHILDEGIIPMTEKAFWLYVAKEIGDERSPYTITEYNEENVATTRDWFQFNLIKRLKKDVPEMKAKQFISPVYFELAPLQKQIFFAMIEEQFERIWHESGGHVTFQQVWNKFPYFVQLVDNTCLLEDKLVSEEITKYLNKWKFAKDPRFEFLDDYLKECISDDGEKVIIYDYHPETLNQLEDKYKKYEPLIIHGQIKGRTDEQDQEKIDLFNDPKSKHRLILLSAITSSAGLNLQEGSRRIVVFTMPNDATLYEQLLERTHRIVSERDTIVKVCVFDQTYDYIRYIRNTNRVALNEQFMTRNLSKQELKNLLQGIL